MEKLDFIDSKFRLAILAAKRAKQLVNGARKRVDKTSENPLTIALEEIYSGKINFQVLESDALTLEQEDSDTSSSSRLYGGDSSAADLLFGGNDDDDDDDDDDNILKVNDSDESDESSDDEDDD